jgi:Ca2+-binding EF-hand superfamily protein
MSALTFGAAAQNDAETKLGSGDYCDTMWSQVDMDGDGFVSKQEARDDLELRFSAIDKDGDGDITRVEYVDCQTGKGAPVVAPVERSEETFRAADADSDAELDRQEFASAARGTYEATRSDSSDQAYKSFASYVWLTREEAGSEETTIRQMTADQAAFRASVNFNALDANNDNVVDISEWAERDVAPGYDEAWANARFYRLDGNDSGTINKEEFSQVRTEMIDEMTTAATVESDVMDEEADTLPATENDEGVPVETYHFSYQ